MNHYEPAIRTFHWFFGALVALGLTHLFRDQKEAYGLDLWPAFFTCATLCLRYLLGSANHMWYEYVALSGHPPSKRRARLLRDFAFLAVFGFLSVRATDSETLPELLWWNMFLLMVGLLWTFLDWLIGLGRPPRPRPRRWQFWFRLNLAQLVITLAILAMDFHVDWRVPVLGWSLPLTILSVAYLLFLGEDLRRQFMLLENASVATAKPAPDCRSGDGVSAPSEP